MAISINTFDPLPNGDKKILIFIMLEQGQEIFNIMQTKQ